MNKLLLDCVRFGFTQIKQSFVALTSLHYECLVPRKNPLHLYPESPQKLHPNVQLNAPAPRINSRIFFLVKAKGNNKDRFAHHLKVANRSFSVAQTSPARCVSEREKGENLAPGDSKGRSPWRAFGDFPRDGKVTRGGGAERPPHRGRGGAAPTSGSAEGQRPSRRSLRGGGAERPLMGVWGPPAPTSGSRNQVWRLAPEGAQPLARAFGGKGGASPL